ncbi:tetratricopeptide repeat protein [Sulfurovum sp. CS9]|uniref:tetratricopeptide repeat protein n=1 Tax=Sulfurovum sp. CS9 TaxID=3391146 RepID=UPI0039E82D2F
MNQTKKRLKIIKLAISITDMETIQLQILKLSPLKTDAKIQEIIAGLQAENYAQTQALITTYIETPMDEVLQRSFQKEKQIRTEKDRAIIKEFDLFVTTPEKKKEKEKEKELFDFSTLTSEDVPKQEQETIDFDALLNIKTDDILTGNIELDISHMPKDTFFDLPEQDTENTKESHIDTSFIPKDTFFDIEEPPVIQKVQKEKVAYEEETTQEEPSTIPSEENIPSQYRAIPYIDQKFKNMHTQYPPVQESDESFSSVNAWLLQISNDGYTNDEVEEIIKYITKLTEENSLAEAAQLLLISGATKSKFAQFMLARALYAGKILQKKLPESFTLINRLAMDDDYPEAICDLAQFYENGIGIDKDKKKAEALYKDAMDLGIKRAISHYERIKKQNSGLFSTFKK